MTVSDKVNPRTNVLRQERILCDNRRCNPQRRHNNHKTLHNIQHSRQLHKTKPLTMQGEFENVCILMAESFTVFQKLVDQIGFKH